MPRRPPPQHPPMSKLMVLWYGLVLTFITVLAIGLLFAKDAAPSRFVDDDDFDHDVPTPQPNAPIAGQAAPGE